MQSLTLSFDEAVTLISSVREAQREREEIRKKWDLALIQNEQTKSVIELLKIRYEKDEDILIRLCQFVSDFHDIKH